jgi:hypothetical protein
VTVGVGVPPFGSPAMHRPRGAPPMSSVPQRLWGEHSLKSSHAFPWLAGTQVPASQRSQLPKQRDALLSQRPVAGLQAPLQLPASGQSSGCGRQKAMAGKPGTVWMI